MATTPRIGDSGLFTLLAPWTTTVNLTYTVIGVRTFTDLYNNGQDVQSSIYVPMGLTDGVVVGTPPITFSFAVEAALNPKIITLQGSDGSTIYVPDTFISAYPDISTVPYSLIVLSLALSAVPDTLDLTAVKLAVSNAVSSTLGLVPVVNENRMPSHSQPTEAQAVTMEAGRLAAITVTHTLGSQLLAAQQANALLQDTIDTLVNILRVNGLLPT
jgi:hypothetical protein